MLRAETKGAFFKSICHKRTAKQCQGRAGRGGAASLDLLDNRGDPIVARDDLDAVRGRWTGAEEHPG